MNYPQAAIMLVCLLLLGGCTGRIGYMYGCARRQRRDAKGRYAKA